MKIFAINQYTNTQPKLTNFKAHPDLTKLAQTHNVYASSYFRRGPYYGSPSEGFASIINLFNKVFSNQNKQKMLIVGIGDSQEPFSYLAVIKSLFKNQKISDLLDLITVDLQSKPDKKRLFNDSYFEFNYEPEYAKSSFIKDIRNNIRYDSVTGYYRVTDEIFNFLNKTYNQKSLWDTRIQEAIETFPNEEFDLISINNVIGYLSDKHTRVNTLNNIDRTLKKGGTLITDPYDTFIKEANLLDKFEKTEDGIYKKK